MKGDATYEKLDAADDPTPTHILRFEGGPDVRLFVDNEGELAITVDGPNDEDFRGPLNVTVDGLDVTQYNRDLYDGWQ